MPASGRFGTRWPGFRGIESHVLMQSKLSNLVGEEQSSDELVKEIYVELKRMARGRLHLERQGMTLNTTALVHEAWMRLEKSAPDQWRDRGQFFAAASEAMRRILVEAARRRLAAKRGSDGEVVDLDGLDVADPSGDRRLLFVHEALEQLEAEDAIKAQIVKLRFFGGMENEEIAALLDMNEKTVRRHWAVGKVWLFRALGAGE